MSTWDTIKELPAKLLKRVSKNSNAQKTNNVGSVNSKYSYLSLLDRDDNRISYSTGRKILKRHPSRNRF